MSMDESFTPKEISEIYKLKYSISALHTNYISPEIRRIYGTTSVPPYIIAGGIFCSYFYNEKPRDIDVFFLDPNKTLKLDDSIYVTESNFRYYRNKDITKAFRVHNSDINLIETLYKTREELIDSFDMEQCKMSYDPIKDKLFVSPITFHAINTKTIFPAKNNVIQYRIDKYLKKGYVMIPK